MKIDFQDKYISTLEDILSLRRELQSSSLLLFNVEEKISLKVFEIAALERKLAIEPQVPPSRSHTGPQTSPQTVSADTEALKHSKQMAQPKVTKPKSSKACKTKKRKEADRNRELDKRVETEKKKDTRKTQDLTPRNEKELPPIEIDPNKYVPWTQELQESLICWNEIIKSTHPGTLSHLSFTDKFRIEQAIHDFLSIRLHWRDIQYCAAINRLGMIMIAIPEDWADDFSDWFSERIGAGLLDSKIKEKRRSKNMQPVLGVKHGNEYEEFPDSLGLVYPEYRSWLEIVRIRFPAFSVGFIHEEFVRDYLLSRNITFKVVEAEIDKDSAWGVPSKMEEEFFTDFISMFHYYQNGGCKVHPKTHWKIPTCRSIEYLTTNQAKLSSSTVVDGVDMSAKDSSKKHTEKQMQPKSSSGIFGTSQVQSIMRPFRKAIVNGTELFHWRDVIEDKFGSDYDELLNDSNACMKIGNLIRCFLNGALLPAGLNLYNCLVSFSDDSDSEEDESEDQKDFGIPALLKEEFELWFANQIENGFGALAGHPERDDEDDEFDEDSISSKSPQ